MKKAAILGASGLVGSYLVKDLCDSTEYDSVLSIARSPLDIQHPKFKEQLGDLLDDTFWDFNAEVDVVFICIGTTKAKTPDEDKYKAIDYGIPLKAAKWAKENGAQLVSVVSSMGASAKSSNFYLKTKGQLEEALQNLNINIHIIRPSMILGPRQEKRFGEKLAKVLMQSFKFLIPANYKPVEARDIAAKMLALSKTEDGSKVILSKEIVG